MENEQDFTHEVRHAGHEVRHAGNDAAEADRQMADEARNAANEAAEASRRVMHAGATAGEDMAQAGQRTVRAGARAGKELADAGQQTARTGVRISENVATAVRESVASGFDTLARLAQQGGDGQGWIIDLHAASRNLDGVLQSNVILARGLQSAWIEWLEYNRRSMERNAQGLAGLARSRSFDEFITRQNDLLKTNIEDWLHSSIALFDLSAQSARDAADKVKGETRGA